MKINCNNCGTELTKEQIERNLGGDLGIEFYDDDDDYEYVKSLPREERKIVYLCDSCSSTAISRP